MPKQRSRSGVEESRWERAGTQCTVKRVLMKLIPACVDFEGVHRDFCSQLIRVHYHDPQILRHSSDYPLMDTAADQSSVRFEPCWWDLANPNVDLVISTLFPRCNFPSSHYLLSSIQLIQTFLTRSTGMPCIPHFFTSWLCFHFSPLSLSSHRCAST
jgi:hypothetical protein